MKLASKIQILKQLKNETADIWGALEVRVSHPSYCLLKSHLSEPRVQSCSVLIMQQCEKITKID